MKKVVFITNIPNPYRIPLFNEMSRQLAVLNIHLKLVFGAAGYQRRMFQLNLDEINFDYEILDDKGHTFSKDGEKTVFFYRGLLKLLRKEKPDAILVAGFSSATQKVLYYKVRTGTPYIIFSGTIETGSGNKNPLRKIQRKILLKNASAFVAYGNLAKHYLVKRGPATNRVFVGRNTVDTTFFYNKTEEYRLINKDQKSQSRFTYLGYLVPRKNVQLLLEAVKLVAEKRKNFSVDIIGDGISRKELEKYVADNNLEKFVVFHGFRQKDEIPQFFAQSNGLLFQTDFDIWGLVLNEAMAAGLPCLSSPNAGATFDLIKEGETGFVVDFKDSNHAAEKIIWLIDNPEKGSEMGKRAAAFIRDQVNITQAAAGFKDAIVCVLNPI